MANLTLNIPNAVAIRVQDAICKRFGYTGLTGNGKTTETKQEFVKRWMINTIKENVKAQEAQDASIAAGLAASQDADNNIDIT